MATATLKSVFLVFILVGLDRNTALSQEPGKATKENPTSSETKGSEPPSSPAVNNGSDWVWTSDESRIHNKIELLRGLIGAEGRRPPIMLNGRNVGSNPLGPEGVLPERFYVVLMQSENLRKELGMTESQTARFKRLCSEFDKSLDTVTIRSRPKDSKKESLEERQQRIAKMLEDSKTVLQSFNEATSELLTSRQFERLDQIALQIRGPLALSHPKIAELVGLSAEQFAEVKRIVEELTKQQMSTVEVAFAPSNDPKDLFHYRPLPPEPTPTKPKTDDPKAEPKKTGSDSAEVAKAALPKNRNEEKARRLDWASVRLDAARDEAISRIGKCLSRQQKTAFNQLLGRRVNDLAALIPDDFTIRRPGSVSTPPASPTPASGEKK